MCIRDRSSVSWDAGQVAVQHTAKPTRNFTPASHSDSSYTISICSTKIARTEGIMSLTGSAYDLKKAELVAMLDAYYAERGEVPNIAPQNDTKTPSESPDTSTIPIADSDSSVEFIRVAHRSPTSRRKSKTNATGDLEKAMEAINLSSSSAESDVPGSSDSEAIEAAETQESLALDLYGSEANDLDEVLCNAIYQDKHCLLYTSDAADE